jgi:hypothetical protein
MLVILLGKGEVLPEDLYPGPPELAEELLELNWEIPVSAAAATSAAVLAKSM